MSPDQPPHPVLARWRELSRHPGGKWLFSVLVGRRARYTGSIGARVVALEPGHSLVALRDRKAVRNHLDSIHAVAIANLAEVASGLALLAGLPADARSILLSLAIDYTKKARGPLLAEGVAAVPETIERQELEVSATVRDASGEEVAIASARWLIGPGKKD